MLIQLVLHLLQTLLNDDDMLIQLNVNNMESVHLIHINDYYHHKFLPKHLILPSSINNDGLIVPL
ncbi:hypothetical protein DERP_008967 [Dermatophagoides pteronyssinus]|uniref:Uncharacterized protein n=1 Tax=Dermatophagoides pteronyssinus TaxID=6956 RepID=A0ABQ8JG19_DERPT|nr:hypothetical protein DERP_008967 [Dermatophagoides pteronyssinus]